MFDELFDNDRERRNGEAAPRRGGIRGLLDRLMGGLDGDDRDDRDDRRNVSGRRDERYRRDDRNDGGDLFGD